MKGALARILAAPDTERCLGAFKLVKVLGRGGFAPVWLAHEVYGDAVLRTVAVKLVEVGAGAGARAAVVREARALCQVEHPNVVRFLALAEDKTHEVIGLVMEHVHGTPLDRKIEESGGALAVSDVVEVGLALAAALAAVHSAGLLHRDVKPANVVETAGLYKLIDFGVAALLRADTPPPQAAATEPEIVDDLPLAPPSARPSTSDAAAASGTLGYVDPECVRTGNAATPASDLYGLGATLYECLTGSVPAVQATIAAGGTGPSTEVLDGRASPPAVRDVAPETHASLAKIIDALVAPAQKDRPRTAEIVLWELERVRREIGGRARSLPTEDVGPFRGLDRFEAQDRDVYLGRTGEIAAVLEMLRTRGLVALVGPSGSGKSSLARAGVVPAVTDGDLGGWPRSWDAVVITPGVAPDQSLKAGLEALVPNAASLGADALVDALGERAASKGRGALIVIDPLEEIVTVASKSGRQFSLQLLARIGHEPHPGVRAIVTVRRDLLDRVLALGEIARLIARATILVEALSVSTWLDVLELSLELYGYRLEDAAMREQIRAEIAVTVGAMPLIQFALRRLWEERDQKAKVIRRASLEKIGGLSGGLEQHADATLERIWSIDSSAPDVARRTLLALTTPDGTRVGRRPAELLDLVPSELTEKVVRELERARLLVREGGQLSLSHEALLTQWGTLRGWLVEARGDRSVAEEIERDAEAWVARPEAERLWKGRRLAAAEDLARRPNGVELTTGARSFVKAGRTAEFKGRALQLVFAAVLCAGAATAGGAYVRALIVRERLQAEQARKLTRDVAEDFATARAAAVAVAASAETEAERAKTAQQRAHDAEERARVSDLSAENAARERDKIAKDLEQAKKRIPRGAVEIGPIEKPPRP